MDDQKRCDELLLAVQRMGEIEGWSVEEDGGSGAWQLVHSGPDVGVYLHATPWWEEHHGVQLQATDDEGEVLLVEDLGPLNRERDAAWNAVVYGGMITEWLRKMRKLGVALELAAVQRKA